jgi:hypothetical protein
MSFIDIDDFDRLELPLNLPEQFIRVPGQPRNTRYRTFEDKVTRIQSMNFK